MVKGAAYEDFEVFQVNGLFQEVKGTGLGGFDGKFDFTKGGHDNDGHFGIPFPQTLEQINAICPWQHIVGKDEAEVVFGQGFEGIFGGGRFDDGVVLGAVFPVLSVAGEV